MSLKEYNTRARSCTALARPLSMSSPLCPPMPPAIFMRYAFPDGHVSTGTYGILAVVSTPPAQPTKSSPSSSESRLMRIFPVMNPGFNAFAPNRPVSSDTVNKASIRPSFRSSLVITASCAAMPMPQSAPRVVSLAISQPSSISYFIGSFEKS